jgi:tetratricopeptide (TPR) repeat protein
VGLFRLEAFMKKIAIVLFITALALTFTIAAAAQTTAVKGKCTDQTGAPIVGGTVEFTHLDSGRVMKIKTDKNGDYMSLGMSTGSYKITLFGPDGKQLFFFSKVPVTLSVENNVFDFDLKKEAAKATAPGAMSEEQKKKLAEAQKENQKIGNLNAMLKQAADFRAAGQCDQAAELMTQASSIDATKHQIWNSLAESDNCAKKYPEAIAAYKKAIELNPTSGGYYNNMAGAMMKANMFDDAIAAYTKAAEVDPPQAAMYHFNEGAVLYNKGKMPEAAKAFDQVLALDPTKADAYYYKGAAMLGNATLGKDGKMEAPAGTAEAFNKYLELQPTGAHAGEAKAMLEAIGAKVETTFGAGKKKGK